MSSLESAETLVDPPPSLPQSPPSRSEIFELATSSGPTLSKLDPRVSLREPHPPLDLSQQVGSHRGNGRTIAADEPCTLSAFRDSEGPVRRLSRLRDLFDSITAPPATKPVSTSPSNITPANAEASTSTHPSTEPTEEEKREANRKLYARELWQKCGGVGGSGSTESTERRRGDIRHGLEGGEGEKRSASAAQQQAADDNAVRWTAFEIYAEEKEKELWRLFVELDVDGDMRLRKEDVREACARAGVDVKDSVVEDFVSAVDKNKDGAISFDEWRDFLLLLPRRVTTAEIFRYYQTHRMRRPSMSRLTQDGDVVVGRGKTGWNKLLGKPAIAEAAAKLKVKEKVPKESVDKTQTPSLRLQDTPNDEQVFAIASAVREPAASAPTLAKGKQKQVDWAEETVDDTDLDVVGAEHEEEHNATHGMFSGAGKFLLAGGVAGAVSRTATAPFDRLKVYLITSPSTFKPPLPPELGSDVNNLAKSHQKTKAPRRNKGSIPAAVRAVWRQGGGLKAFWTGNGLNVVKIFPESAIKFLSYESAKRVFAQYWDHVPDQTMISNTSRFVAGGIGGVVSQFVIYPIETLKTRVMSSTGGVDKGNKLIARTAVNMWQNGGLRLYFRGLPAGLIGVFPYSAIDMSTFEGIKLAYTKWSGDEPGIPGSLAFGALSGGIGATSVYPLNLVRTRLQAQGTPAHPQRYDGVRDAARKCYVREGWRGFYKGLTPTLVKVVPAVAISYAVYDASKKVLFSQEDLEVRDHEQETEES